MNDVTFLDLFWLILKLLVALGTPYLAWGALDNLSL
jgi:hypothetical protein